MKKTISILVLLAMLVSCLATLSVAADAPDTTVALQGYQKSAIYFNANNAPVYDIRIVATGTDEAAKNVGFTVTAEDFDKEWDKNTTTVYESLSATDSKGNSYEAINAEDEGVAYVYAMVIKGVPADADVNFSVTPYKTDAEGKKEGANGIAEVATSVVVLNSDTSAAFTNDVVALTTSWSAKIRFTTAKEALLGKITTARVLYSSDTESSMQFHFGGYYGGSFATENTNGSYQLSDAVKIDSRVFDRMANTNAGDGTMMKTVAGNASVKAIYFFVSAKDSGIEVSNALTMGTHLTSTAVTDGAMTLTTSHVQLSVSKTNSYAMGCCSGYIRIYYSITGETDNNGAINVHDGGYVGNITGLGNTDGYVLSNTVYIPSIMNNRMNFISKVLGYEGGSFFLAYNSGNANGTGTCTIKAIYFFDSQAEADAFVLPTA